MVLGAAGRGVLIEAWTCGGLCHEKGGSHPHLLLEQASADATQAEGARGLLAAPRVAHGHGGGGASYLWEAVGAPASQATLSGPPRGQGGQCLLPVGEGGSQGSRVVSWVLLTGLIGGCRR